MSLKWLVVAAAWGAFLVAALYMLRAVRVMLHGPLGEDWKAAEDPTGWWRRLPFVVLLASLMVIGVWPRVLTDRVGPSVAPVVEALARGKTVTSLARVVGPEVVGGEEATKMR